jgi:hypothetical protein
LVGFVEVQIQLVLEVALVQEAEEVEQLGLTDLD